MISLTWKCGISKLTHQHRQSNCIFRIDFYFLSLGILTTCGLQTYLFVMFFSFCFCKVFENMFGWFMFWVFGYLSPSKLECWRPWYLAPLLQSEHYKAKFFFETLWWSGCRSKNCRQDGTFSPSRQSLWKLLHLVLHCSSLDLGCNCTLPSCLLWWEFLGFNVEVRKTCRKPRNLCKTRSVCQRWYCSSRRRRHQQEARVHSWPTPLFQYFSECCHLAKVFPKYFGGSIGSSDPSQPGVHLGIKSSFTWSFNLISMSSVLLS